MVSHWRKKKCKYTKKLAKLRARYPAQLEEHKQVGGFVLVYPFTAEVTIMRLLGSAPMSHLCDKRRRSKVTGVSGLMTLFIDLGCLYCKQMQRAFIVFKNMLN
jgi:hypothetical protein